MSRLAARLPSSLRAKLSHIKYEVLERRLFTRDRHRFLKHYSRTVASANVRQLGARLIFHAHSIEKGLSHSEFRPQFGERALSKLGQSLEEYLRKGFDQTHPAYVNAQSVISEYVSVHEESGESPRLVSKYIPAQVLSNLDNVESIGGVDLVEAEKVPNTTLSEVMSNRRSIREFADSKIEIERLEQCIDLAMKAPSICNRQSARVRVLLNEDLITETLAIQGGMTGYPSPPALICVTSDLNDFLSVLERNQIHIDGGIFGMALLLSLQAENIAACPLNAMFDTKRESRMRSLLGVPDNETFVFFIACGDFPETVKSPKSFRFTGTSITEVLA